MRISKTAPLYKMCGFSIKESRTIFYFFGAALKTKKKEKVSEQCQSYLCSYSFIINLLFGAASGVHCLELISELG